MIRIRLEGAVFQFDHIAYRSGAMDALLTVWREKPDDPLAALDWRADRSFRYHISAKSLSNVTAYRRELEKFHGGDINWGGLLHDAIAAAEREYLEGVQSIDPYDVPDGDSTEQLVEGFLPKLQVSCIFGMGAAGKSLAAQSVCAAISTGSDWAGRRTISANALWLDYEAEHEGDFARRRRDLAIAGLDFQPDSIRWMAAKGVPLTDLAPQVSREMLRFGSTLLVVDSVAFACGGDPLKAEVATSFYSALSSLPVSTKLLVAHTDKAENDKYPIGSIFWHNGIHGMSWFLKAVQSDDELSIGFYGRKVSNGPRQRDFAVSFRFSDGISVSEGNLKAVNAETGRGSLADRIISALGDGTRKSIELATMLKADEAQVRARLKDLGDKNRVVKLPNGEWGLKAQQPEEMFA